ncbi:protein NIF3 homolog [Trichoderma asperellum]|uniref:Protein NIF3 homolog n=1 Tax=Trichoderma asperellum TaxID=101201 RepID=A0A6V8QR38_TRIAP|nr:protein NIF3 homolog [Trichoderma asperellum]
MVLARLLRNSLSPALRTASPRFASSQLASLQIAVPRQHSSVIASSTSPPSRRTISTTRKNLDNNIMTDYSDGVGAWGAWQAEPSKFTQQVVDAMRTLYPEELADRKWDNVGLLIDNSDDTKKRQPTVMVTNDLTFQVAVDAIGQGVSVIVSYHPFIFSGLKSITNNDPQQATLLQLVKAGIAVYCPHTAVDAAPKGLNTWLADIVSGPHKSTRSVAIPCATAPETHSPAGYGSIGRFENGGVSLAEIIKRVALKLGGLKHIMVASPVGADIKSSTVRSFGVCAGSGYDVLKSADVDLLVMGETSHHSALRAIQQGKTLIQVFHSNSERGYLREVLKPSLEALLKEVEPEAEVLLSEFDSDPFRILDVSTLEED